MSRRQVLVGTRASNLALAQTGWVIDRLRRAHTDVEFEIRAITTHGDRMQKVELSRLGGSGVFTRELEEALLTGEIDLAVHSYKDLPTTETEGLTVSAVPERATPVDVLVLGRSESLSGLPVGARVGAGSPRRREALRCVRKDLEMLSVRGNIDTRLGKLERGEVEALVMAKAALVRLGRSPRMETLEKVMLPAPAQGALAVQTRIADTQTTTLVGMIHDRRAGLETRAERRVLDLLGGGCHLALGVLAQMHAEELEVRAAVYADGEAVEFTATGPAETDVGSQEVVRQIRGRFPGGVPGQTGEHEPEVEAP